ncbi:GatA Asp-tRNAAsn/Glu-tRNAGln amidotransferase A subunit and related amidases [Sphingomonadaceae bacterium]|jgi:aspartyl-tRNA(Asn)/glutamyl-tRNA(Gln) amidotransferase subunit A|uniref:amidase n=1 Tax=Sphingorhabdus sp. TaxID=1902408 RepID=UPI0028ED02E8|nr:amidase [uncultured Sphingorhabdus sp.]MCF8492186.1 amidase [Sphingomonadaceae bacterium]
MIDFDALVRANAPLNAFTDFDGSAEGGGGALAGLTVGVKANIAVAGMPWTAGCEVYRGRVAPKDAAVVTKLRAAGAAIIGMLNMEEAALGAKTDNPWFGKTENPHKTGYTPGGSSGGSGSAVAAGLCDIALGTDTMGSVRIPAAYCGVYGFKPAQTSVSQEGLELAEEWLDCIGPLARSLDLLESAARVMTDFGDGDAASGPLVTLAETGVDCELEVIEKFRDVIRLAGSEIAVAQLAHPLSRIRFAGFIKTSKAMAAHFADAGQDKLSANLQKLLTYGPKRSDADWAEDQAILAETAQAVQDIVAKHAAIILPTAPQGAFSHSEDAPANQADYTCLANIANLPAISLPMGVDDAGMPLGLQIVGRTGHEADLFQLAREFDAKLQAYRRPDHFLAK